jgi:hypothetical protein
MIPDCDCATWASESVQVDMLGNGHHHRCQHFKPDEGAMELLTQLVEGIEYWASQEDGVPEELWDAYARAVFITRGKVLDPKQV